MTVDGTWVRTPVVITRGDLQRREQGYFIVPKRDLVAGLERGQLKIAEGLNEGEQLAREMAGMRVRVKASGREGERDDLALAVALACRGESTGYLQRDGEQSRERDVRKVVRKLMGGRR